MEMYSAVRTAKENIELRNKERAEALGLAAPGMDGIGGSGSYNGEFTEFDEDDIDVPFR